MKHSDDAWDDKHFDKAYYEKSEKTPYGGFLVPYTWENFQNHAFWKMRFIKQHFDGFGIKSILFGGCAKGFEVRAARELGYDAWGIDVSEYAIANVDPEVKDKCMLMSMADMRDFNEDEFDLVASFDVWHTVHPAYRDYMTGEISRVAKKGVLIRTGFKVGGGLTKVAFKPGLLEDRSEIDSVSVEWRDPEFNGTFDGNPSYQDSIGLFAERFDKVGKFHLFYAPVVWDRDYFIWYCLCRHTGTSDALRRAYGGTGGCGVRR